MKHSQSNESSRTQTCVFAENTEQRFACTRPFKESRYTNVKRPYKYNTKYIIATTQNRSACTYDTALISSGINRPTDRPTEWGIKGASDDLSVFRSPKKIVFPFNLNTKQRKNPDTASHFCVDLLYWHCIWMRNNITCMCWVCLYTRDDVHKGLFRHVKIWRIAWISRVMYCMSSSSAEKTNTQHSLYGNA